MRLPMIHRFYSLALAAGLFAAATSTGCNQPTAPKTSGERQDLRDEAKIALRKMNCEDAGLKDFLYNKAHAYAVFPSVGKGGFIAGGAYGRGAVFRKDEFLGYAELNQVNVGALIGGQTFAEILAFENEGALQEFTNGGEYALAANAAAVFLDTGVAGKTNFHNGIAVFVEPNGGVMADLSLAGQKFNFQPAGATGDTGDTTGPSDR